MAFVHVEPHTLELLTEFLRGFAARIGQEEKFFLLPVQPLDKLPDARQQPVAMVDNAVHITKVALFAS